MCCFFTALIFFGPRLAILVWYLISPVYVNASFGSFILPCLGFVFLPWTTLMFIAVYPGGVTGFFEWLLIGLGVFADIASYAGGGYNRKRVPGYTGP